LFSWYFCLLVIVLSVLLLCLSFGHCIVCPPVIFVFWTLYCLSSCYVCLLVIVTMTKRQKYQEDRQYNDQKTKITGGQTIQWPKDKHNIVCPPDILVFWSLYFLSSCYVCLLVIVLSVLLLFLSFGHCIVCPPDIFVFWSLYWKDKHNRRTENTMTKRQEYQEDRQYNDQKTRISGGQKIQWPKDKHNRRTLLLFLSFGHCIFCPPVMFVFWSLYCLSSCYFCLLVIVLSVLLLCLSTMTKRQNYQEDRQYNDQKTNITGGQKIQWPKDKHNRRTENTMTKRQK
jgi:hypothetical protein